MSVTTYATLKTGITDRLERSDLAAETAGWIALAQGKAYSGMLAPDGRTWLIPPLRIRDMINTASITVTAGAGTLPAGWIEFLRLKGSVTDSTNLEYVPPEIYWDFAGSVQNETPLLSYTTEGTSILTLPAGSDTLNAVYYAKLAAMSADGDADAVLTNAPHVWLNGALAEACDWIGGMQDEVMRYTQLFASGVAGLNANYKQAQHKGGALIMRPRAVA